MARGRVLGNRGVGRFVSKYVQTASLQQPLTKQASREKARSWFAPRMRLTPGMMAPVRRTRSRPRKGQWRCKTIAATTQGGLASKHGVLQARVACPVKPPGRPSPEDGALRMDSERAVDLSGWGHPRTGWGHPRKPRAGWGHPWIPRKTLRVGAELDRDTHHSAGRVSQPADRIEDDLESRGPTPRPSPGRSLWACPRTGRVRDIHEVSRDGQVGWGHPPGRLGTPTVGWGHPPSSPTQQHRLPASGDLMCVRVQAQVCVFRRSRGCPRSCVGDSMGVSVHAAQVQAQVRVLRRFHGCPHSCAGDSMGVPVHAGPRGPAHGLVKPLMDVLIHLHGCPDPICGCPDPLGSTSTGAPVPETLGVQIHIPANAPLGIPPPQKTRARPPEDLRSPNNPRIDTT